MSAPPDRLTFFTDRDLGTRFPEILANAGLTIVRHRDRFPPDCDDETWLEAVGKAGWIAVSHDSKIRYKPNELDAVRRHGVRLLVVIGKAPLSELAENFARAAPRIRVFVAEHRAPWIAKVYRPSPKDLKRNPAAAGDVVLWYPR